MYILHLALKIKKKNKNVYTIYMFGEFCSVTSVRSFPLVTVWVRPREVIVTGARRVACSRRGVWLAVLSIAE